MVSITGAQRELLLDPTGNNVWSGLQIQSLNSHAITWSLARQLYGPSGRYFVIPIGIFIGFGATFVHWFINKVNEQTKTYALRMVETSDANSIISVALALHWSPQGRQCRTSDHYPVRRLFRKSSQHKHCSSTTNNTRPVHSSPLG